MLTTTFMATCHRCGGKFGHPGPCPACCPSNAFNLNEAVKLAVTAHDMQFRKGRASKGKNGPPYIVHICGIMSLLWEWGYDADRHGEIFQLACTHDSVEEKGTTLEYIAKTPGLGTVLAGRTRQMTYDEIASKDDYLKTFLDPHLTDVESLIVKEADRCCNVEDFLITDRDSNSPYAAKYFKKGEPLYTALVARRDQVIEYSGRASSPFPETRTENGRRIYHRIQATIDSLRARCV